ncbi:MAG: WG repeat-containing protein [Bacteroidetes bacterium]|nr:MAG: WG repeat-containing protein [Bacteroidota bacterium]TAG89200.1 MAG: WG repeat-containing protein [Bacteroidota bacterium]
MKNKMTKNIIILAISLCFFNCGSDKYDNKPEFINGFATVNLNGKYGVIDEKGKEIVPCKYEFVGTYIDGIAKIKMNNKIGLIDDKGKEIVPCKYDKISLFNKGLAKIELSEKCGYLNKEGKEILSPKYEAVNYNFIGRYFEVAENGIVKRIDEKEL